MKNEKTIQQEVQLFWLKHPEEKDAINRIRTFFDINKFLSAYKEVSLKIPIQSNRVAYAYSNTMQALKIIHEKMPAKYIDQLVHDVKIIENRLGIAPNSEWDGYRGISWEDRCLLFIVYVFTDIPEVLFEILHPTGGIKINLSKKPESWSTNNISRTQNQIESYKTLEEVRMFFINKLGYEEPKKPRYKKSFDKTLEARNALKEASSIQEAYISSDPEDDIYLDSYEKRQRRLNNRLNS